MASFAILLTLLAAQEIPGRTVKIDAPPYVESEFTRRFTFDSFDNPKLKELREKYNLDEVVAPGKDEFDRQVFLLDWTHRQFKKFGRPSANPRAPAIRHRRAPVRRRWRVRAPNPAPFHRGGSPA